MPSLIPATRLPTADGGSDMDSITQLIAAAIGSIQPPVQCWVILPWTADKGGDEHTYLIQAQFADGQLKDWFFTDTGSNPPASVIAARMRHSLAVPHAR